MTCKTCGETKCSCKNKYFTKAVIEIDNPEQITLMRKVVIPASMGDDTTVPPVVGKYKNVLLFYEANSKSYLYSSDGIPTLLANGLTDYEQAVNLPQINGVTLTGDKSAADLGLQSALTAGDGIEIENDTISISDIEQYAHFFDTVADMKSATNLVAGDYAKTLGFHTINDGGGALYKISNTGTANEMDIIAIDNLYATLIKPTTITPEIYGAYGDGTHDDTTSIQRCMSVNNDIHMSKTYLISSELTFNGAIHGESTGVIKQNTENRITGAFVKSTTRLIVDGLKFDCGSNVEFTLDDKFQNYNIGIIANGYLEVKNCEFRNLYEKFIQVRENTVEYVNIHDNLFSSDNKTNVYMSACLTISSIYNNECVIEIHNNTMIGYEFTYVGTYDNDYNINASGISMSNIDVKAINIDGNTLSHLGRQGSVSGNAGLSRLCAIDAYFNVKPLRITNNKIIDCHWTALRLHGTNDAFVDNNLFTLARACAEPMVLISDAYNTTGEAPVGCDNVTISNNNFYDKDLLCTQCIYVNSYTGATVTGDTDGFFGHVNNLNIINNNIQFCCKYTLMFDYSLKTLNFEGNFIKGDFSSVSGIGTHNMIIIDNRSVMKTATTGKSFANTILNIMNNDMKLDSVIINFRTTDAELEPIYALLAAKIENNIMENTGAGYVAYATANAPCNYTANIIRANVGGINTANKALNNIIFYSSTSAATYNVTTDQNNSKYTN